LSSNPSEDSVVGQSSSGDSNDRNLENMQMGFALLPNNLDLDLGLLAILEQLPM
jgi:hypothetical protein